MLPVKKQSCPEFTSVPASHLDSLEMPVSAYEVYGHFLADSYIKIPDLEFEDKRPTAYYSACLVRHAFHSRFYFDGAYPSYTLLKNDFDHRHLFLPKNLDLNSV